PFFVSVNDDFRIAMGAEDVTFRQQLIAQFVEIIYLAVVGDCDRAVFVRDGLMARGNINDGEPPRPQPRTFMAVEVKAFAVRAAMFDHIGHAVYEAAIYGPPVEINYSANS